MRVHFFFRKPSENYHSIERLFMVIQRNLSENIEVKNVYNSFSSKGILKRIYSAIIAAFKQGDVNHITGDIHFLAAFMRKSKTFLTIHDVEILKRTNGIRHKIIKHFWFKMPIAKSAKVSVISEFSKVELLNYVPNAKNKLIVIPNCIDAIYLPQIKVFSTQKPVVLQVGTKHNKNLERVIESLNNINCKLLIVGNLSKKQINLLNLSQIDYLNYGHISLEEMYKIYLKADILLFVSTYEGFGLPILEAQAVGRPVICSNVASMPYVAGDAAIQVNPHKVEEIRLALETVIESKSLRNSLIEKGFENVKRYSAKEVAREYAKVYSDLAGKS